MSESPDVFVSYCSDDRARVSRIVELIESKGVSLFWDGDIAPSENWRERIEGALTTATRIVVVWSERSVTRDWVLGEAAEGREREGVVLVPVHLDSTKAPREFRAIQSVDLSAWDESESHPEFRKLLSALGVASDGLTERMVTTQWPTTIWSRSSRPTVG